MKEETKIVHILRDQFDPEVARVVIGADSEEEALKIARDEGEEFDYAEKVYPYIKK